MPPPPMRPGIDAYVENADVKSDFGFNSSSIRAAFIRKVFMLVGIMVCYFLCKILAVHFRLLLVYGTH